MEKWVYLLLLLMLLLSLITSVIIIDCGVFSFQTVEGEYHEKAVELLKIAQGTPPPRAHLVCVVLRLKMASPLIHSPPYPPTHPTPQHTPTTTSPLLQLSNPSFFTIVIFVSASKIILLFQKCPPSVLFTMTDVSFWSWGLMGKGGWGSRIGEGGGGGRGSYKPVHYLTDLGKNKQEGQAI